MKSQQDPVDAQKDPLFVSITRAKACQRHQVVLFSFGTVSSLHTGIGHIYLKEAHVMCGSKKYDSGRYEKEISLKEEKDRGNTQKSITKFSSKEEGKQSILPFCEEQDEQQKQGSKA